MARLGGNRLQARAIHDHINLVRTSDNKYGGVFSRAQQFHIKSRQLACAGHIGSRPVFFVYLDLDLIGNHLRNHLVERGVRIRVNIGEKSALTA